MSGINILDPVAWRFCRPSKDCFIYSTNEPKKLDGYVPLITADQAEEYKNACVQEILEKVVNICDSIYNHNRRQYKSSGCNPYFEGSFDAIDLLLSKIYSLMPEDTKK